MTHQQKSFHPFLPSASLLHSSKLLRESSASLLHRGFRLPKLRGIGKPKAVWFSPAKAKWFFLSWLLHLGLNSSTSLPLQPHFSLLPQLAIHVSILVFFQLFWAAIVNPGRCGPVAWSQSSPTSYTGSVTRGNCLPVTSLVEVTPISPAQSTAKAF